MNGVDEFKVKAIFKNEDGELLSIDQYGNVIDLSDETATPVVFSKLSGKFFVKSNPCK